MTDKRQQCSGLPNRHWCPDSEVRIILKHPSLANFASKGTGILLIPVWLLIPMWLWFGSPHDGQAAAVKRTSGPPHQKRFAAVVINNQNPPANYFLSPFSKP
jgi:hypothetical protein